MRKVERRRNPKNRIAINIVKQLQTIILNSFDGRWWWWFSNILTYQLGFECSVVEVITSPNDPIVYSRYPPQDVGLGGCPAYEQHDDAHHHHHHHHAGAHLVKCGIESCWAFRFWAPGEWKLVNNEWQSQSQPLH